MRAIDTLRAEHEEIHEGLSILLSITERLAAGEQVARDAIEAIVEFFEEFADGIHHAKEEQLLFPALERAGFPRTRGPLSVMFSEHDRARQLLRIMRGATHEGIQAAERSRFVSAAQEYADLLANHVGKEDGVLFVIAERLLAPADAAALDAAFDEFDAKIAHRPKPRPVT